MKRKPYRENPKNNLDISSLKSKVNRIYLAAIGSVCLLFLPSLLGSSINSFYGKMLLFSSCTLLFAFIIFIPIYLLKIYPIGMKKRDMIGAICITFLISFLGKYYNDSYTVPTYFSTASDIFPIGVYQSLLFAFYFVFIIFIPIYLLKIYPIGIKKLVTAGAIWMVLLITVAVISHYQHLKNLATCERSFFGGNCWITHPLLGTIPSLLWIGSAIVLLANLVTLPKKIHPKYTLILYLIFAIFFLSAWIFENGYSFLLRFF